VTIGGTIPPRTYVQTAALAFIIVFLGWLLARGLDLAPPSLLPGPADVAERVWTLAADGTLFSDLAASVGRILVGFAVATLLAIPIGVLIGTYRLAEAAIEPLVDFVRYMPVVGFVPLTIIWIGLDETQKWAIVFIGTFFQEVLLVMDNVKRVPRELVDIGYTLGMRDAGVMTRIIVPSAAPAIWDTLRISLGWAWTWIVLAELVAAASGLGYRITVAQRYFQTDTIIGYLLVLGVLGLITDQSMKVVGRTVFRWAER
jgi:NitT/TauT family transport system permease protein